MLAAVARPPLAPAQRRLLRTLGSVVAGAAQLEQAMAVQASGLCSNGGGEGQRGMPLRDGL